MPRIFFSWDDGHPDDFRLKDLHEKYTIPCMLFIPARNAEGKKVVSPKEVCDLHSEIIEIGSHTLSHLYLEGLPEWMIDHELSAGKDYLEQILGYQINHFCFPGGRYDRNIMTKAKSMFQTVRTTRLLCVNHSYPVLDTTFHFYPRGKKSLIYHSFMNVSPLTNNIIRDLWRNSYYDFIKSCIEYAFYKNKEYDFIIWGHSWEISYLGLWKELDNLFRFITENHYKCCQYSTVNIEEQ